MPATLLISGLKIITDKMYPHHEGDWQRNTIQCSRDTRLSVGPRDSLPAEVKFQLRPECGVRVTRKRARSKDLERRQPHKLTRGGVMGA